MTVYVEVINLARAPERRAQMEAELAEAGIEAAFHPAFDYKAEGEAKMLEYCTKTGPWGRFEPGNMAVTISHGQVWERFLATEATYCVVFEDDVFVSPELGAWLRDMSWWPDGADIVKIERWRGPSTKVLLEKDGTSHMGRRICRMFSRHIGAAGYVLTRKAADRLLRHRPFRQPIDNYLFNANASPAARHLALYQVTPALVVQGNDPIGVQPSIIGRARPTGWALIAQKARRGWHEVAYPLSTLLKFLSGQLVLATVPYTAHARVPQHTSET